MKIPKISIIVPVYNVAPFIERCAHSLFSQTMEDLEFIFINDATPDNSIELLNNVIKLYPERKVQIKILYNNKRKGPAFSRQIALKLATAPYIISVDSDDYIETIMMQSLYEKAINTNADIVLSDIIYEYKTYNLYEKEWLSKNKNEWFKDKLSDKTTSYNPTKLIKRCLLLKYKISYSTNLYYLEDRLFSLKTFYYANNITIIHKAFYHYNKCNTNSITTLKNEKHLIDLLHFWEETDKFLAEHNLTKKYANIVAFSKVEGKANNMLAMHNTDICWKYANIFHKEEMQQKHYLHRGRRFILWILRHKFHILLKLYQFYIWNIIPIKEKIINLL